jgi:hypothetical protein
MTKDEALKMRIEQDEQWSKIVNRKWQALTDDEISDIYCSTPARPISNGDVELMFDFAKAIEQALKEKNT